MGAGTYRHGAARSSPRWAMCRSVANSEGLDFQRGTAFGYATALAAVLEACSTTNPRLVSVTPDTVDAYRAVTVSIATEGCPPQFDLNTGAPARAAALILWLDGGATSITVRRLGDELFAAELPNTVAPGVYDVALDLGDGRRPSATAALTVVLRDDDGPPGFDAFNGDAAPNFDSTTHESVDIDVVDARGRDTLSSYDVNLDFDTGCGNTDQVCCPAPVGCGAWHNCNTNGRCVACGGSHENTCDEGPQCQPGLSEPGNSGMCI